MNKLISRNPVQRFKQGRKIKKCGGGDLINYHGQTYTISPSGSGIYVKYDPKTKTYDYNKQITSTEVAEAQRQEQIRLNRLSKLKNSGYNVGYYNKELESNNSKNFGKANNTPFYQFGKMGGWNNSMGSSIDQDSLNKLQEMGYNIDNVDAQTIQNEINKVFGNNAVKADNKWGNQSRAGLQALYERWQSLQPTTTETKPSITQPSITQTPEFQERLRQQFIKEETPEQQTDRAIFNNVDNLQFKRNGNYNKSQLRDYMRSFGLNPYDFKGSERKALRLWLNGQSNDNSLLTGKLRDLFVTPYVYKQGGQLPSRNIVERFKQRNFRLVAQ